MLRSLSKAIEAMNTPKHTPGPWSVVDAPDDTRFVSPDRHFSIQDPAGVTVALVFAEVNRDWLNCMLIASAPELLQEARNALNVLAALATGQLERVNKDSPAIIGLRAAIAKAEGRE